MEVQDYRGEDAIESANLVNSFSVPGVNNLGIHGRWTCTEFAPVFEMERLFGELLDGFAAISTAKAA